MSNEVEEAGQFFLRVCKEHGRRFPLRNIIQVTEGYRAADDKDRFFEDVIEWLVADVRRRLEQATADMAAEARFGGPAAQTSELELMEEATRLVAEARKDKSDGD